MVVADGLFIAVFFSSGLTLREVIELFLVAGDVRR